MRRINFLVLIIFVLIIINSCDENKPTSVNEDPIDSNVVDITYALCNVPANSERVEHFAYYLSYNEEFELSDFIAYQLLRTELDDNFDRTDDFRPDPLVSSQTANSDDYKGSGYDRGHLMPAADCSWDSVAMTESFYYSNVAPQPASFNRGIWSRLESQVRDWAIKYDSLYVVTGGILEDGLSTIGENEVAVPNRFYKILIYRSINSFKAIGFIMNNENSQDDLLDFAVTIDEVELATGLDFISILEDELENSLESEVDLDFWAIE